MKSMKQVETSEDNDTDTYALSIVDKYSDHPDSLEDMCLADFATNFTYGSSTIECDDKELCDEIDKKSTTIKLRESRGVMKRRKKSKYS